MGCCVSKREHQRVHRELRRLQKERQQLMMAVVGFNKAKQDSIADRNRLYDSETENMLLREQLLDASVEMDKAAEDLNVKLLIIGVDV